MIARKFRAGDYRRIVFAYSDLVSNENLFSVYRNVFRVASLLFLNDPKWLSEYKYIIENSQLDLLGEEDAKYIKTYLYLVSKGISENVYDIMQIDMRKVSKRTKKYFPWKKQDILDAIDTFPEATRGIANFEVIE